VLVLSVVIPPHAQKTVTIHAGIQSRARACFMRSVAWCSALPLGAMVLRKVRPRTPWFVINPV
jgi:hypothetical protein